MRKHQNIAVSLYISLSQPHQVVRHIEIVLPVIFIKHEVKCEILKRESLEFKNHWVTRCLQIFFFPANATLASEIGKVNKTH